MAGGPLAPPKSKYRGTMGSLVSRNTPTAKLPTLGPNRSSRTPGRINLKAVSEALAERGLDPTEAIIDILRPIDPVTGEALPCKLDPDVQARVLNELLQYTQPKLKSVEIKAKVAATAFDVNDEQARRIAEEFLRASED